MSNHICRGLIDKPCDICSREIVGYIIDADDFIQLRALQSTLHAGSDDERDIGHKIWCALNIAEELPVTEAQLNAIDFGIVE